MVLDKVEELWSFASPQIAEALTKMDPIKKPKVTVLITNDDERGRGVKNTKSLKRSHVNDP